MFSTQVNAEVVGAKLANATITRLTEPVLISFVHRDTVTPRVPLPPLASIVHVHNPHPEMTFSF